MNILVIGGTGHIGTYLIPALVGTGHAVQVVSRNSSARYGQIFPGWDYADFITADRVAEERTGSWAERMLALTPDVVIDLICFMPKQNRIMIAAFQGRIRQFLHCGSIWAFGRPQQRPGSEDDLRRPLTDYGHQKAAIETDLLEAHANSGFPATIIHPGHISAPYWSIIDPAGGKYDEQVYRNLATGEAVMLADDGKATLQHVHARDLAALFIAAINKPDQSIGESFFGVCAEARSLTSCCEMVAGMFNRHARKVFVPLDDLREKVGDAAFDIIESHVLHDQCFSAAKARRRLGFIPQFTIEDIYREYIMYHTRKGFLRDLPLPPGSTHA